MRVVGGFTEHQFAEKRLPTLDEINAAAPDTPVFMLHLYDRALLNGAALRAVGYTKDTPEPAGGEIVRDAERQPDRAAARQAERDDPLRDAGQGAEAAARVPGQLDAPLHARAEPARRDRRDRRRRRLPELSGGLRRSSRSCTDDGQLTVRIAYNLFTQKPKQEKEDFLNWIKQVEARAGRRLLTATTAPARCWCSRAADFEDFRSSRAPTCRRTWRASSSRSSAVLAENRWPWRLHATYDETITRALDVFEKVNRDIPLDGLHWFFDHAETIADRNIDRIANARRRHRRAAPHGLPGRILRRALRRRGGRAHAADSRGCWRRASRSAPAPMRRASRPTTRGCRSPGWSPARTVGGLQLYPQRNWLDRETALRLWTEANTWFSNEDGKKGQIKVGQLADLAVLSDDYFAVPGDEIQDITSVLTMVGGKVVYGDGDFKDLAPPLPPAMPDWSPVRTFGGYQKRAGTDRGASTPSRPPAAAAPPAACTAMRMHGD